MFFWSKTQSSIQMMNDWNRRPWHHGPGHPPQTNIWQGLVSLREDSHLRLSGVGNKALK